MLLPPLSMYTSTSTFTSLQIIIKNVMTLVKKKKKKLSLPSSHSQPLLLLFLFLLLLFLQLLEVKLSFTSGILPLCCVMITETKQMHNFVKVFVMSLVYVRFFFLFFFSQVYVCARMCLRK